MVLGNKKKAKKKKKEEEEEEEEKKKKKKKKRKSRECTIKHQLTHAKKRYRDRLCMLLAARTTMKTVFVDKDTEKKGEHIWTSIGRD